MSNGKLSFPEEFEPIPLELFDNDGRSVPAFIRKTTAAEAELWITSWLPAWERNGFKEKSWPMAHHIRRSSNKTWATWLSDILSIRKRYMCLAVESRGNVETLISLTLDIAGRESHIRRPIVYVEYLINSPETHPLLTTKETRRTSSSARSLLATAAELSLEAGLGGWIGLDAKLGKVSATYQKWGMKFLGKRAFSDGEFDYLEANLADFRHAQPSSTINPTQEAELPFVTEEDDHGSSMDHEEFALDD